MWANSMSMVLENDPRQLPMRPSNDVLRHVDLGRGKTKEKREVANWVKESEDWQTLMHATRNMMLLLEFSHRICGYISGSKVKIYQKVQERIIMIWER